MSLASGSREEIRALARGLGFARDLLTSSAPLPPVPTDWPLHPQARGLADDPAAILPEARSVYLLAMPYRPYPPNPPEAEIDAYYVASNRAHAAAQALARALTERGARAVMTSALRVKPLCARSGFGQPGRNTLISVGDWGTRVCLQTLVTDLPPDPDDQCLPIGALDERCAGCLLCARACPTGALRGDGALDIGRCVRAQPESEPLSKDMMPCAGASLLGCDRCQRVCPRNAAVSEAPLPEEIAAALRLDRLLAGDYRALIPYLGKNNARKLRLMSRAAVAAANRGRRDLAPALARLACQDNAGAAATQARLALDVITREDF